MAAGLTPELPRDLQVEVTGACNLRCRMCLVSYRPTLGRREGAMGFDTFRGLVDGNPRLRRITLQGLGEPLLAPDLFRMVEYATRRGIDVGFNTNGMLLTPARAERLIRAGLTWLHVSMDGATPETYVSIRGRADFGVVSRHVRDLVEVRRALGADRPELSLVFVAMRRNVEELPRLVELAAEWGVGRLWVQNLSHVFDDTDPAGDYRQIREFAEAEALWNGGDRARLEAVFAAARTRAEELDVQLRLPRLHQPVLPRTAGSPGCDWPWRAAYVTHEGTVQPCCMVMGSDRAELGDLRQRPLAEVWRSQPYQRFRAALLTDDPADVCRGCSAYRRVF